MPKLYSARLILKALQKAGFEIISQRGSHIKLAKTHSDEVFTVIVPNHKEIAIGTFLSILKQSGLTKQEMDKLLK